jgi:hypothetical protein
VPRLCCLLAFTISFGVRALPRVVGGRPVACPMVTRRTARPRSRGFAVAAVLICGAAALPQVSWPPFALPRVKHPPKLKNAALSAGFRRYCSRPRPSPTRFAADATSDHRLAVPGVSVAAGGECRTGNTDQQSSSQCAVL